jgi:hypothetical protein
VDIARRHEGDEKAQKEALEKAEKSSGLKGRATVRGARKAAAPIVQRQKTRGVVEVKEGISSAKKFAADAKAKWQADKRDIENLDASKEAQAKSKTIIKTLEWVLGSEKSPWEK